MENQGKEKLKMDKRVKVLKGLSACDLEKEINICAENYPGYLHDIQFTAFRSWDDVRETGVDYYCAVVTFITNN